jgi:hypothetical protein
MYASGPKEENLTYISQAQEKKKEGNVQLYGIRANQKSKNFEYILDDSCGSLHRRVMRLLSWLRGQLGEKYFNYSPYCSDNSETNISTTLSSTSSTTASTAACHARGLIAVHSRKLSATLGGSTSTRPGVRKLTLKTCDFVDISNAAIPTTLGGSTTTSPPIVVVILRQQLDYVIVDYGRTVHAAPSTPHPIKAKFSSSKS